MKTATAIRNKIEKAGPGALFSIDDFVSDSLEHKRETVKVTLHRLATKGILTRARRGLYWKSARSRFGSGRPLIEDVVVKVGEGKGTGPTGWLASHTLGLTTQIPAKPEFVVVGGVPRSIPGALFHTRVNPKRAALTFDEVALLEVLRSWPRYVDGSWSDLVGAVRHLDAKHRINLRRTADVARYERPHVLRERLARLRHEVEVPSSAYASTLAAEDVHK